MTIERLRALHRLAEATGKTSQDFYFEDKAIDLQELADYAQESKIPLAVLNALEEVLDSDDTGQAIPAAVHSKILSNKHKAEAQLKHIDSKLAGIPALEAELIGKILTAQIKTAATELDAINPDLVALLIGDQAQAKLTDSGKLNIILKREDGQTRINSTGDQKQTQAAPKNNPFIKGPGFNLTEQGQIFKENRALAEKLRVEAITQAKQERPMNSTEIGQLYKTDPQRARQEAKKAGIEVQ